MPILMSANLSTDALLTKTAPWQQWNALRWSKFTTFMVLFFIGAVVLRSWVITAWLPQGLVVTQAIHYGGIFAVTLYILLRGNFRLDLPTLAMVVAFSFGSFFAIYQKESFVKWFGLVATIAVVGPLIQSRIAVWIRVVSWKVAGLGFVVTALASLMWVIFPLPRIEYGLFTGISLHPKTMALGAALSVCFLAAWMTRANARLMGTFIIISFIMVVLSGSRTSVVASLVSLMVVFFIRGVKYFPLILIVTTFCTLMLFWGPLDDFFESKTGQYYLEKGISNTREHLWELRFSEIKNFPLFGVGIGMAEQILPSFSEKEIDSGYAYIDENGRVRIEPGSSWLAVFSMTGFVGGTLFLIVFVRALRRLVVVRSRTANQKFAELVAVAVCYSIHMLEGGFILSFGNPDCLFFWLWLGHVYDCTRVKFTLVGFKKFVNG